MVAENRTFSKDKTNERYVRHWNVRGHCEGHCGVWDLLEIILTLNGLVGATEWERLEKELREEDNKFCFPHNVFKSVGGQSR